MDSIHDLGGRQGFGRINVNEPEIPFKHEWEGRAWAIVFCSGASDWTLDWWRHIRETIDPVDYLTRSYFDSWTQTQMAGYIDSGVFTLDELLSEERKATTTDVPSPLTVNDVICEDLESAFSFEMPVKSKPQFSVGQSVVTTAYGQSHHTRLPAYARGRTGMVAAYHGAHVFPDSNAHGVEEAGHLYTIAFNSGELWADSEHPQDVVNLDLWEQYLHET